VAVVNLLLNPKALIALALAAVLAFTHVVTYRAGRHAVQAKWDEATVASERAAQEQASRMRELQRAAELRYVVKREAQDRYFVTTVREVHDAAAPLASCPLPADLRRLLDAADRCARDPASSGCAADGVPPAR
jgi:hypothetical protein